VRGRKEGNNSWPDYNWVIPNDFLKRTYVQSCLPLAAKKRLLGLPPINQCANFLSRSFFLPSNNSWLVATAEFLAHILLVVDRTSVRFGGSFRTGLPNQTEPNRTSFPPNRTCSVNFSIVFLALPETSLPKRETEFSPKMRKNCYFVMKICHC
jgi:hypothetical protein